MSPDVAYDYHTGGTWSLGNDAPRLTADGDTQGRGRLEGVIFSDYELSEPFPLGKEGTFHPPAAGRLYLRCRDDWNELADNRGTVQVIISRADNGPAQPRPASAAQAESNVE